jgi:hypothetical protein
LGGFVRGFLTVVFLFACAVQAFASTSVSCDATDAALKFTLEGAWGRTRGSGPGNFGGEIEIRLKGVPDYARKLKPEMRHLTQNWFHDRDLRLAVVWMRDGDDRSVEVILQIETARKGKAEEAPYRGRYTLTIFDPDSDGTPRKATGRVSCVASD